MSNLFFSQYLANRYPNPEGRRIQIGILLSGLGNDAISTQVGGGGQSGSLSAMGQWSSLDATSLTTLGQIADIDLLGVVENTVILTEKAPITKGYGDAQLAEPDDVEVRVNGQLAPVVAMDPILGVLVLDQVVPPDSEVEVSYHYTQNPTLEISSLNSTSFRLNQWNDRSRMPFTYNAVLGPYKRPQPRQYEYRYRAFDYPYTSVLNDPTSLTLNEPKHRITVPRFQRENSPYSIFFEGDTHPVEFEHEGPPLGPVQIEDGLYIIDDVTSSSTVVEGQPSFFHKPLDMSFEYISILNWRTQVLEWEKSGDFTGIAGGYSDTENLYFVSFLEIGSFKTLGILADENEEEWQSYRALSALVLDPSTLAFNNQPPLSAGSSLFVDGSVYEVDSLEQSSSQWLVTLVAPMTTTETEVQVFPETDWSQLTTYRLFKSQEGSLQVRVGGNLLPHIQIDAEDAATSPDIFGIVETNSMFFGSFDRKTTSKSGWDFYRFSLQPATRLEQSQEVVVNSTFEVLPEQEDEAWHLSDNQGYATIQNSDYLFTQGVGQYPWGGGITYTRLEPFLTSKAVVDLSTRVRVHSYATGIPAFLTIADDKKEVTLGFFDEEAIFTADTEALITKGFWSGADATALQTQGNIAGGVSLIPPSQYVALFSGTRPFEDIGWSSTIAEEDTYFFDSYMRVTHDGSPGVGASYVDAAADPATSYVLNCRMRIRSWDVDANGKAPIFWGMDDGVRQTHLMPYEDPNDGTKYIVLCNESGSIVMDGPAPVGFEFDWDDNEYHAYKAIRFASNVSIFVDGVFQAAISTTLLPASTSVANEATTRLRFGSEPISVDLDYLFAHSSSTGARRVGLYRGGPLLDTASYDFVSAEWLGSFAEIRVRRDPTSRTSIFINDPDTPVLEYQYSELPDRVDNQRFNTNTDLGYIQFGTMDPNALSEVVWDYMRYSVVNPRALRKANNAAILNRHNVMSSPEPILDEGPEEVVLKADGTHLIHLAKVGMYARNVLAVLSEDGMTTYPFTYDGESNTIALTGSGLPSEDEKVKVVFYHRAPFTEAYLENNWAFTRLNVDTPPMPLKQEVELEAVPTLPSSGDGAALLTKGFWANMDATSIQTQGLVNLASQDYQDSDGPLTITFKKNPEAFYESLKMLETYDDGDPTLLAPACDEDGLLALDFEGPFGEDQYQMPPQCGSTEHRYKIGFFNDLNSTFNNIQTNTAYPSRCFTMELAQTFEEEVVALATDEVVPNHPNSYMEDFYGFRHTFNSMFYTLNGSAPTGDPVHPDSVVVRTNRHCESGCIIDLFDTPLVPIDPNDYCVYDQTEGVWTCPVGP